MRNDQIKKKINKKENGTGFFPAHAIQSFMIFSSKRAEYFSIL